MSEISDADLARAIVSPRFAALSQLGLALDDLVHWDRALVREPRLLVPVDVIALVVRAGDESMVRLPFRSQDEPAPAHDDPGTPRPPGVHLLWTVPTAFGRGKVVDDPAAPGDPTRRVLDLPLLPDRWVVVRLCVPSGATDPIVRGWVIEADTATATPLADWPSIRTNTQTVGTAVPADRLTVHVGGAMWTMCYDASLGRMALHDPLDDLAQIAPNGVVGDALSYVVAGWWDDVRNDPLDGVGSLKSYHGRLLELGWDDPDHPLRESVVVSSSRAGAQVSRTFNLPKATRFTKSSTIAETMNPAVSGFAHEAIDVAVVPSAPTRTTLLHGRIHGVPLSSTVRPDDRPARSQVRVALGPTSPSVAALLASGAFASGAGENEQRNAERLLTAFSSGLLGRIEQPDVWPDIEQYEHAQGFSSLPGGVEAVDRFVDRPRTGNDPGSGFRHGRRVKNQTVVIDVAQELLWSADKYPTVALAFGGKATSAKTAAKPAAKQSAGGLGPSAASAPSKAAQAMAALTTRSVERPAPAYHAPISPVMALVGPGRRILAAERDEADGMLRVRTSDQPVRGLAGVVDASRLLRSIGSGAVPDEVLTLAREAVAEDPYLTAWRSERAAAQSGVTGNAARKAVTLRVQAESTLNYAYYAGDDERLAKVTGLEVSSSTARQRVVEAVAKHSLVEGVWAHPEGVTMWGQPWRPLFCEWSVELDLAGLDELVGDGPRGWVLDEIDLEREQPFPGGEVRTLTGRSPLVPGVAKALAAAVDRWIADERMRDTAGHGLASPTVEGAMVGLRDHLNQLDVLSVTLDGIREQLLGLRYDRGLLNSNADADADGAGRALAIDLPRLVAGGRLRVVEARLVDSFGRVLDLAVESASVVARAASHAGDGTVEVGAVMQIRPRVTAPVRLHLRLVDPVSAQIDAASARVDQAQPELQVNPVAGFLLPDHIDEALEMFDTAGAPLGQVSHDPFSDAVFWEGAPGRTDIGPAAGPLDDTDPAHTRLGWIASALVAVDATARQASPTRPETESPLSALLRAIDTTLWTVDPLGAMGREHIAGLVGRPIAVVTAHLTLDVLDELDELVYADTTTREARAQAFAELAATPFAVRLGCATRSDDRLLGYFVDDDYTRLHVIDRVIAEAARESGRCRGDLGPDGVATSIPITHSYVETSGELTIRHGQTVRLTLLMHPGGKAHLTAGIVPRSSVALARDWVQPGLSVMAPSVRVGPLLIDADKVRLPKVASFPADQLFTRRDSPGTWKDDPILAATQTAYLPDQASEVQEGWIRVAPKPPSAEQAPGG